MEPANSLLINVHAKWLKQGQTVELCIVPGLEVLGQSNIPGA